MTNKSFNKQKIVFLIIVPFIFLGVSLALISNQPLSYVVSCDPSYMYLLNGLNFAQFKIFSGSYIHPGIPLQLFCAFIIKITYFFAEKYPDIVTDVFQRPDFYINIINSSFVLLTSVFFFFVGKFIFKLTGNIFLSIFFQSILFVNSTTLFQITIISPEKPIIPLIYLLICLLVWYIYKEVNRKKFILLVGIVVSICVMQKLTMLPLLLLPLFILKNKKELFYYIISVCATIFFQFIPIISHSKKILVFFTNLTTHSGNYGTGNQEFINFNFIIPNIKILMNEMTLPMYCMIFLFIFIIISFSIRKKQTEISRKIRKIMIGSAVVEIIIFIMIIKHFTAHYFTPVAAFSFFNIYLCFEYLRQVQILNNKLVASVISGGLCLLPILNYPKFSLALQNTNKDSIKKTITQIESKYRQFPTLIISRYYGTPFVEFSIFSGNYWSYNIVQYGKKLISLYPNSYLYTSEWGTFDMAYNGHQTKEILQKHDKFIVSYYHDDTTIDSLIRELDELKKEYTFKRTIYDERNGFVIAEVNFIPHPVQNQLQYKLEIDMETDREVENTQLSKNVAKSGVMSLILDEENEKGAIIDLKDNIKQGSRLKASVWRYNNLNNSSLVIGDPNSNNVYFSSSEISENQDPWCKIELDVQIPDTINSQFVKVYLLHNDIKSDAYFDDLSIDIFQ